MSSRFEVSRYLQHGVEYRDTPSVSVIIPVRNEGERLLTAIASVVVGRSCCFPLQIVVVDDASTDGCCDSLEHLYSWWRDSVAIDVVRLPRWSGIPYARNAGAAVARAQIFFITDANVRFPSDWDIKIREQIAPNRVLCATIADEGSSFRGYGGTLHLASMSFDWLRAPTVFSGSAPLSACTGTVLSAELFQRAGGYDTAMPVYGAAEPEFSVRLWLIGAEIQCVPDLVLKHRFRPPSERRPFLDAIRAQEIYNYLRFGLLYLDPPRITEMMRYYAVAAPEYFDSAVKQVWAGDVWQRRDLLQQRLPMDFDSFVKRFRLDDTYA
jgi:glycosyltransferase involved in cell wall biosynthesis